MRGVRSGWNGRKGKKKCYKELAGAVGDAYGERLEEGEAIRQGEERSKYENRLKKIRKKAERGGRGQAEMD